MERGWFLVFDGAMGVTSIQGLGLTDEEDFRNPSLQN